MCHYCHVSTHIDMFSVQSKICEAKITAKVILYNEHSANPLSTLNWDTLICEN
jgi:hypothetical protein